MIPCGIYICLKTLFYRFILQFVYSIIFVSLDTINVMRIRLNWLTLSIFTRSIVNGISSTLLFGTFVCFTGGLTQRKRQTHVSVNS